MNLQSGGGRIIQRKQSAVMLEVVGILQLAVNQVHCDDLFSKTRIKKTLRKVIPPAGKLEQQKLTATSLS